MTRERLAGVFVPSFPQMTLTQQELDFISASEIPILILSEPWPPNAELHRAGKHGGLEQAVASSCRGGCRRLAYLGPPPQWPGLHSAVPGSSAGRRRPALPMPVFWVPIFPQTGPQMGHHALPARRLAERPDIDGLVLSCSDKFAAGALWYLSQTAAGAAGRGSNGFQRRLLSHSVPTVSALYMDTDEITRLAVEQLAACQAPRSARSLKQVPVQPCLLVPRRL